jgi:uncharacterized protein YuzE
MKLRLDSDADALYFRLDDEHDVVNSEEVQPGVILDFDAEGRVVGLEILDLSTRVAPAGLKTLHFDADDTHTAIPVARGAKGS